MSLSVLTRTGQGRIDEEEQERKFEAGECMQCAILSFERSLVEALVEEVEDWYETQEVLSSQCSMSLPCPHIVLQSLSSGGNAGIP